MVKSSQWNSISAGVPQGSVLGPLLFLVFINDLSDVITNCNIRIFADDSCLFITVDNRENAARLINDDLVSIENWAKKWLVNFSPTKTESMIFSLKRQRALHPRLIFQNVPVTIVTRHKHVGLWFESNLSWHYHINEIYLKTQNRLKLIENIQV